METELKEGYSISPNSGRLRKKIRVKKKKEPFSKRKAKKYWRQALWIFLLLAFVASLLLIFPELGQDTPAQIKKKERIEMKKRLESKQSR